MDLNIALWSLLLVLAAAYFVVTIPGRWQHWLALAFLPMFAWLVYTYDATLGRAKSGGVPASAELLHAISEEPRAIYLLLAEEGSPRLRVLPWSRETAEQIRRAQEQSQATGGTTMFRGGNRSLAGEPMAYSQPPQENPPKKP